MDAQVILNDHCKHIDPNQLFIDSSGSSGLCFYGPGDWLNCFEHPNDCCDYTQPLIVPEIVANTINVSGCTVSIQTSSSSFVLVGKRRLLLNLENEEMKPFPPFYRLGLKKRGFKVSFDFILSSKKRLVRHRKLSKPAFRRFDTRAFNGQELF